MTTKQFIRQLIDYRLNDMELQQSLAPYGGMAFDSREEKASYIDNELDELEAADALQYYLQLYQEISIGLLNTGNINLANSITALCLGLTLSPPASALTVKGKHFNIEEVFVYFYSAGGSDSNYSGS